MEYLIPLAIFAALGILAGVLLTLASKVFVVFHYIIIHKIKGHLNAVFDINVRCSRIVIDRRYDAVWVELFYTLYYASCTGVAHKAAKRQQHHNTFAAVLQR